jgi:hypothetical protein
VQKRPSKGGNATGQKKGHRGITWLKFSAAFRYHEISPALRHQRAPGFFPSPAYQILTFIV